MTRQSATSEILLFEITGLRGGFLLTDVVEVVRAVAITPLPRAPRVVEGIIDLRGEIVPVIDLRARFDLPRREVSLSDRFIVVRASARIFVVRVDQASAVVVVERAEIDNAAQKFDHASLAGVAKLQNGLVLVHDVHTFLSRIEAEALDRALAEVAAL